MTPKIFPPSLFHSQGLEEFVVWFSGTFQWESPLQADRITKASGEMKNLDITVWKRTSELRGQVRKGEVFENRQRLSRDLMMLRL